VAKAKDGRWRELAFQFGLVLAAIVVGKLLDTPLGYIFSGVLAVAFIVQWILQKDEDGDVFEDRGISLGTIPWAEATPPPRKPRLWLSGFGTKQVTRDPVTMMWTENGEMDAHFFQAKVLGFTNSPYDEDGHGFDANGIRAQIHWEYDTGVAGPQFSPVMWVDEPCGKVDIPVGWCKWLIVGVKIVDLWSGYDNRRIAVDEQPKSISQYLPVNGKMLLKIIADTGAVLHEAVWSWEEDLNTRYVTLRQLS
jgi:hypothetical protein